MNQISISQAWSYATSFFAGQGANHAIALIGVGILAPLVLQFALGGGAAMADPMMMAAGGGLAAMGGLAMLIALINYVLQTGSYFASWRIGLTNGREPIGSALGFGMIASLPVLGLAFVLVLVIGLVAVVLFGSAFSGFMPGGDPSNAVAGAGLMLLFIFLFFLFLVWLGARLCCAGPIMADRRSFNILSALSDSWRMTAASQWKIFAYFILLGVALFIVLMILGMIVGVSMFAGGGMPSSGSFIGLMVGALLISIPLAYLQVGVPAGIYRALGQGNQSDVFA